MPKTIMIVDDEPNMITLEKAILEAEGFKVISAKNGEKAHKMLETETPDLIILDLMMPGLSGVETYHKIRKTHKTKNHKIIFVSVIKFSEVDTINLKDMKILDYVTKPFNNYDFLKRVKKALEN